MPWCAVAQKGVNLAAWPPVRHRPGAHHQVRAGQPGQVGERGGRLAQAHVVGQAAAEAEPVEELQPPGPRRCVGRGWR